MQGHSSSPRRFQIPNSKPVSSCRPAMRHFSSVELRILEGLSRGIVELICRRSRLAPHGLNEPSAKILRTLPSSTWWCHSPHFLPATTLSSFLLSPLSSLCGPYQHSVVSTLVVSTQTVSAHRSSRGVVGASICQGRTHMGAIGPIAA